MSIALEYFNLIIPISVIDLKYPGGWARCRDDYGLEEAASSSGASWHDGELFRAGAMNPFDFKMLVLNWEELGLKDSKRRQGARIAGDFCLYATFSDGPVFPCDWIHIDQDTCSASFVRTGKQAFIKPKRNSLG